MSGDFLFYSCEEFTPLPGMNQQEPSCASCAVALNDYGCPTLNERWQPYLCVIEDLDVQTGLWLDSMRKKVEREGRISYWEREDRREGRSR